MVFEYPWQPGLACSLDYAVLPATLLSQGKAHKDTFWPLILSQPPFQATDFPGSQATVARGNSCPRTEFNQAWPLSFRGTQSSLKVKVSRGERDQRHICPQLSVVWFKRSSVPAHSGTCAYFTEQQKFSFILFHAVAPHEATEAQPPVFLNT